jgi:hypothetical protein
MLARAAIAPAAAAQASMDRADRQLIAVAAEVARRHGYPDIGKFVIARTQAGASLAAISREVGLHKDWLSRHLGRIAPAAAEAARLRPRKSRTSAGVRHCGASVITTSPPTCGNGTSSSIRP